MKYVYLTVVLISFILFLTCSPKEEKKNDKDAVQNSSAVSIEKSSTSGKSGNSYNTDLAMDNKTDSTYRDYAVENVKNEENISEKIES